MFNQYPYLNLNDLNLDYILRAIKEMRYEVTNFVSINAIKYADPIQWNITSQYEKNTIVIDPVTGTAYISVAPVPAGVALTRPEYWTVVFDLGSFVTRAAQNFTDRWESDTTTTATFPTPEGGWLVWGDVLYKALVNITAGDSYVVGGNIQHFTVEDIYNAILQDIADEVQTRQDADDAINATIGDLDDLATTDKSSIVNAINDEVQARQDADVAINGTIGDLDDLTTTDKTSVVDAINEIVGDVGGLYVHDLTLNVPADYATIMDAVAFLDDKIVGENITIQVADGNYSGAQLTLQNKDFSTVSIIGNVSDPELCTIDMSGGGTAFYLSRSKLKIVNGFKIVSNDRDAAGNWSSTPIGVFAHFDSNVNVGKSMLFDKMYYAIQSANNSQITMVTGDTITSAICGSLTKANVFSLRKGRNICAIDSGDVAYFAYNGGSLFVTSAIAMGAKDAALNLGYGFLSEHSSSIRAFNCFATDCISAMGASDASSLIAHNNNFLWSNYNGFDCKENSAAELIDADLYNNSANGVLCRTNSFILCRRANPNGGGSGFYATDGSFIKCDQDCTCNNVTGYGYYYDKYSLISDVAHMKGTTTGQILIRGSLMYNDNIPSTGNWSKGDIIFNTDPTNGVFAWICTATGAPGTWSAVPLAGGTIVSFTFARPATPQNGDTIFDVSRHKLTTYHNTKWYDASQSLNTFAPDALVAGACYYSTALNKPVYYDGTQWRDAAGTIVTP